LGLRQIQPIKMNQKKNDILRAIALPAKGTSDFDLNLDGNRCAGELKSAGVLVPLIVRPDGINLILTKRAAHLSNHPGQISFPGGKRENGDANIVFTALREAQEEIGLYPESVDVLGSLPTHDTITGFKVTPTIGWIEGDWEAVADPSEVSEVFEVPLVQLMNLENFHLQIRAWKGINRSYYSVPYGPYYIWGATAGILRGFCKQMGRV
jgi:8-oxo-dGTP pyrophosphatase MutT (NUDIX family)